MYKFTFFSNFCVINNSTVANKCGLFNMESDEKYTAHMSTYTLKRDRLISDLFSYK